MENKIDKLFRDKLYQRPTDFKEAYWKEAELLIKKRAQRRRKIWLFSLLLLLGSLSAAGWVLLNEPDAATATLEATNQDIIKSTETKNDDESTGAQFSERTLPEKTAKAALGATFGETAGVDRQRSKKRDPAVIVNKSEDSAEANPANAQLRPTRSDNPIKLQDKQDSTTGNVRNLKQTIKTTETPEDNFNDESKMAEAEISAKIASVIPEEQAASKTSKQASAPFQRLPDPSIGKLLLSERDSDYLQPQGGPITRASMQRWHGGISASASVTKKMDGTRGLDIHSLMVGFEGYYLLNSNMGLHSGLLYRRQSGGVKIQYTSSQTEFSFGYNRTNHKVEVQSLHWVTVPLYLSYMGYKHQIGIGAQFHHLLKVEALRTVTEESTFSSLQTIEEETIDFNSEMIRPYQLSSVFQYSYRFIPRAQIGLRVNYDLFIPIRETQSGDNQFDRWVNYRPWQVGVFLSYDLF